MIEAIAKAVTAQKPKEGGGARSWWRWPLLIVLVLIGVLVAAWVISRDRRELARLRHERNVQRIKSENAKANLEAAENERIAEQALERVEQSKLIVEALNNQIAEIEAAHAKRKLEIDAITWGDLPRADPGE
ncbi:MAG: hypothetical protein V3U85_00220 [Hyphomicrobium sp.]